MKPAVIARIVVACIVVAGIGAYFLMETKNSSRAV